MAIDKYRATDECSAKSFLNTVARNQKNPQIWRDLANAQFNQGHLREAVLHYSQVTRLDPSDGKSWLRMAHAQERLGMINESIENYERAIALRPDDVNAHLMAAMAMPRIIESDDQISAFRHSMASRLASIINTKLSHDGRNPYAGATAFFCAYHNRSDKYLNSLLAQAHLSVFPGLTWCAPHCSVVRKHEPALRIKLGVASNFMFSEHTISKLNVGWIKRICRKKFEVINIRRVSSQPRDYARVDAAVDRVVILPRDLCDARQKVAELKLDVLHYPDVGMSSFFYLMAFARLAPVQSASWGHPDTTGIPNIDYFISSRCLEPPNSAGLYSEKLILLDGPPTYYCRLSAPTKAVHRDDFGLPKNGALYACPHSLFRLHPNFDEVLGALLRRDSKAHLVLISDNVSSSLTKLLLRRLSKSITDVIDRIIFLPVMNFEDWLNFVRVVDCLLDPHTFSGGNTSYEALAMRTPVVTWGNASFLRGRITLALYRALGMSDCVASSVDQYVEIAQRLAHEPAWRDKVVQSITDRSSLVFDEGGVEMIRSLEKFWESAVHGRNNVEAQMANGPASRQ